MIACRVCGQKIKFITYSHLQKHDMLVSEYRERFPNAPISSKETLKKKSELNRDENNPFYGKHHTENWGKEHSKKFSGENHPRWVPRGERICPFCGKEFTVRITQKQRFCSTGCYNEWKKEYYKTHDHPNKGRPRPNELGQYLSALFKGRTLNTGRTHFKKGQPPYWKVHGLSPPVKKPEIREKIRRSMIDKWKDKDYKINQIRAISKATCAKPNQAESELLSIIDEVCPGKYRYNKGSTIINYKIPDFVNRGEKKLIELFGEPWHELGEEEKRIEGFREQGYDCLVIWGKELNDIDTLKTKIEEYEGFVHNA